MNVMSDDGVMPDDGLCYHTDTVGKSFEMKADHSTFARKTEVFLESRAKRKESADSILRHIDVFLKRVVHQYLNVIAVKLIEWIEKNKVMEASAPKPENPPIGIGVSGTKRKISTNVSPLAVDLSSSPRPSSDDAWTDLTSRDWNILLRSIAVCVPYFGVYFPSHCNIFHDALEWIADCGTRNCDDSCLVWKTGADMRKDPSHWGYLIYKYIHYELKVDCVDNTSTP